MPGHILPVKKNGQTVKGLWRVVVEAGIDPATGKRRRLVRHVRGRRSEAQEVLARLLAEVESPDRVEPGRITVAEWFRTWLRDHKSMDLRPTSWERYRTVIERHIVPTLGYLPLAEFRPEHLQRFYRERLEAGCSPQLVRRIHTVIHAALEQAVRERRLARNPADAVTLPSAKPRPRRALTPEEERRFLEVASGDRLGAAFLLAVAAGLRRGEILALRWNDIDWEAGTITVDEGLVYTPHTGVVIQEPKTARSRRVVVLPPLVLDALRAHRERMAREENYSRDGLVFCTAEGTPIIPRNFNRVFYRLRERAGLPRDVNLHALRHTFATRMLELGEDVKVVQEILGHSRLTMTDLYTHVTMALKRRAAERMQQHLSGTRWAQNQAPAHEPEP